MHAAINVCMQNFIHSAQEAKHYEMHTGSWIRKCFTHIRDLLLHFHHEGHKIDGD
jgi:hypothetical protein